MGTVGICWLLALLLATSSFSVAQITTVYVKSLNLVAVRDCDPGFLDCQSESHSHNSGQGESVVTVVEWTTSTYYPSEDPASSHYATTQDVDSMVQLFSIESSSRFEIENVKHTPGVSVSSEHGLESYVGASLITTDSLGNTYTTFQANTHDEKGTATASTGRIDSFFPSASVTGGPQTNIAEITTFSRGDLTSFIIDTDSSSLWKVLFNRTSSVSETEKTYIVGSQAATTKDDGDTLTASLSHSRPSRPAGSLLTLAPTSSTVDVTPVFSTDSAGHTLQEFSILSLGSLGVPNSNFLVTSTSTSTDITSPSSIPESQLLRMGPQVLNTSTAESTQIVTALTILTTSTSSLSINVSTAQQASVIAFSSNSNPPFTATNIVHDTSTGFIVSQIESNVNMTSLLSTIPTFSLPSILTSKPIGASGTLAFPTGTLTAVGGNSTASRTFNLTNNSLGLPFTSFLPFPTQSQTLVANQTSNGSEATFQPGPVTEPSTIMVTQTSETSFTPISTSTSSESWTIMYRSTSFSGADFYAFPYTADGVTTTFMNWLPVQTPTTSSSELSTEHISKTGMPTVCTTITTTDKNGHTVIVPWFVGCRACGGLGWGVIIWGWADWSYGISFNLPQFDGFPRFNFPCFWLWCWVLNIFKIKPSPPNIVWDGDTKTPPWTPEQSPDPTPSKEQQSESATSTPTASVSSMTSSSSSSSSESSSPTAAPIWYLITPNNNATTAEKNDVKTLLTEEFGPDGFQMNDVPAIDFVVYWLAPLNETQRDTFSKLPAVLSIGRNPNVELRYLGHSDYDRDKYGAASSSQSRREVLQERAGYWKTQPDSRQDDEMKIVSMDVRRRLDETTGFHYWSTAGEGSTIYIVDAGLDPEGDEFENYPMKDTLRWFVTNSNPPWTETRYVQQNNIYDNYRGHGNCMWSKAIGSQYGFAKRASTVIVKMPLFTPFESRSPRDKAKGTLEIWLNVMRDVINDIVINYPDVGARRIILSLSWDFVAIDNVDRRAHPETLNAIYRIFEQLTMRENVIIVTASGNDNEVRNSNPVATPEIIYEPAIWASTIPIIVVGATDSHGQKLQLTQWQPKAPFNVGLDVSAPGDVHCSNGAKPVATFKGTSPATASVAGVIAYLLSLPEMAQFSDIFARGDLPMFFKSSILPQYAKMRIEGNTPVIWNGVYANCRQGPKNRRQESDETSSTEVCYLASTTSATTSSCTYSATANGRRQTDATTISHCGPAPTPSNYILVPNDKIPLVQQQAFTSLLSQTLGPNGYTVIQSASRNWINFWRVLLTAEQIEDLGQNPAVRTFFVETVSPLSLPRSETRTETKSREYPGRSKNGTQSIIQKRTLWVEEDAPLELMVISQPKGVPLSEVLTYNWDDDKSGCGSTIYIIDSGMNSRHYEFTSMAQSPRWLFPGKNSPWMTWNNAKNDIYKNGVHGTCSAARAVGVYYGVAKLAQLVMVKQDLGLQRLITPVRESELMQEVLDDIESRWPNPADRRIVINCSWGWDKRLFTADEFLPLKRMFRKLIDENVAMTTASGNDANDNDDGEIIDSYPPIWKAEGIPELIVVGSADNEGHLHDYAQCEGVGCDVVANGDGWCPDIFGTYTDTYQVGTSFASPQAAAICAMLLTNPDYQVEVEAAAASKTLAMWCKHKLVDLAWVRPNGEYPFLWNGVEQVALSCPVPEVGNVKRQQIKVYPSSVLSKYCGRVSSTAVPTTLRTLPSPISTFDAVSASLASEVSMSLASVSSASMAYESSASLASLSSASFAAGSSVSLASVASVESVDASASSVVSAGLASLSAAISSISVACAAGIQVSGCIGRGAPPKPTTTAPLPMHTDASLKTCNGGADHQNRQNARPFFRDWAIEAIKDFCREELNLRADEGRIGPFMESLPFKMSQFGGAQRRVELSLDLHWSKVQDPMCLPPVNWQVPGPECIKWMMSIVDDCDTDTVTEKIGGTMTWASQYGCIDFSVLGSDISSGTVQVEQVFCQDQVDSRPVSTFEFEYGAKAIAKLCASDISMSNDGISAQVKYRNDWGAHIEITVTAAAKTSYDGDFTKCWYPRTYPINISKGECTKFLTQVLNTCDSSNGVTRGGSITLSTPHGCMELMVI